LLNPSCHIVNLDLVKRRKKQGRLYYDILYYGYGSLTQILK